MGEIRVGARMNLDLVDEEARLVVGHGAFGRHTAPIIASLRTGNAMPQVSAQTSTLTSINGVSGWKCPMAHRRM